ncbi:MAG TPA: hypothetical protein VN791_07155 [Acidimicrobiales bacterium]|nr:hypothetical protein [Acidimicrobiales bacterium]
MGLTARGALVLGALVLGAAGCATRPAAPTAAPVVPPGADHACVVPGSGVPSVAWSRLTNPVLSEPHAGVKDQALIWARGRWHMLFSDVTDDAHLPGGVRWGIGTSTSTDLVHWSPPVLWPRQRGVIGVVSPDIVRSPTGTFVVTYDSGPGEVGGGQAKLYYRTSADLRTWSAPHQLAPSLHPAPAQRMIDPALAWTGHGLILGYKDGPPTTTGAQHFEIAWSRSGSVAGPWVSVGRPDISLYGDTVENLEFLTLDGRWALVATSNTFDQPWLFSLVGNPGDPASWLHWTAGSELQIPARAWDSGPGLSSVNYERANSVFLCDARAADGYYYATYAGSTELTAFDGWGHARIGIARSTDLVHWQVPG